MKKSPKFCVYTLDYNSIMWRHQNKDIGDTRMKTGWLGDGVIIFHFSLVTLHFKILNIYSKHSRLPGSTDLLWKL